LFKLKSQKRWKNKIASDRFTTFFALATALILITTATLAAQIPQTEAQNTNMQEEKAAALTFLNEIAGVDMSAYNISYPYPTVNTPPLERWLLIIHMNAPDECTRADFDADNNIISFFSANRTYKLQPLRQGITPLNQARTIIETFYADIPAGSEFAAQVLTLLDQASPGQDQTITEGNFTLTTANQTYTFSWDYVIGGTEAMCALHLEFSQENTLKLFMNRIGIVSIANPSQVITEQEAQNIALPIAQKHAEQTCRTISHVQSTFRYDFGQDRHTLNAVWHLAATYEKSSSDPWVSGYEVTLLASDGAILDHGPVTVYSSPQQPFQYLPAILTAALSVPIPVVLLAVYKRRKQPSTS